VDTSSWRFQSVPGGDQLEVIHHIDNPLSRFSRRALASDFQHADRPACRSTAARLKWFPAIPSSAPVFLAQNGGANFVRVDLRHGRHQPLSSVLDISG